MADLLPITANFTFPIGTATLHCEKSESQVEPKEHANALYISADGGCSVYTDNETDTYYLRDGDKWYGLAAFSFCGHNRTHFRDYFIQDIRVSAYPVGKYGGDYQPLIEQLQATREHGKAKVIITRIRALFERQLIESVILQLLPRSDSLEILGSWQLQEKLFNLGFKPAANAYRRGEPYAG